MILKMNFKRNGIIVFFLFVTVFSQGQNTSTGYLAITSTADSLFFGKEYQSALNLYLKAFDLNNGLGKVGHRYRVAICWVVLNNYDSAFSQLYRIATIGKFSGYEFITVDPNFNPLHDDNRWKPLIELIWQNKKENQ